MRVYNSWSRTEYIKRHVPDEFKSIAHKLTAKDRESLYRYPTPRECLESFASYLKINLETATYVRNQVIEQAGVEGDWKHAKVWYAEWISTSGTTETLYPVENGWYQLAGSLPGFAGEKYHAGNSKRHCKTMQPENGGVL